MIADARTVPDGEVLETDVCIVGGGVAGATLARELSGRSLEVCVLEAGDLKFDARIQELCEAENVGHPYFPLKEARALAFGGTSHFWEVDTENRGLTARIRPLDRTDFTKREWVPHSGWPLTLDELLPFYARAESLLQVGPHGFEPEDWDDPNEKQPPLFSGDVVESIVYKFASQEVFTRDLSHEMRYGFDDVLTLLFAHVTEVETDEAGRNVTGLQVACLGAGRFRVSARLYVLAAGGIEIPRLMLGSNRVHANGLGNSHDLVGRYFMEHLHTWSGIWIPPGEDFLASIPAFREIRVVRGVPVVWKLVLSERTKSREGLLNQNIQLFPRPIPRTSLHPKPLGSGLRTRVLRRYRRVRRRLEGRLNRPAVEGLRIANMAEQVPNPSSRVVLTREVDALGMKKVALDWQLTPGDIESIRRTHQILAREIAEQGLGRLVLKLADDTPPANLHGGYHHMGTTRMHDDPREGVVDRDGRVHGLSNLFIAGPSVFPTGGYANPVLTIVALSMRLADHIVELSRKWNAPLEVRVAGEQERSSTGDAGENR